MTLDFPWRSHLSPSTVQVSEMPDRFKGVLVDRLGQIVWMCVHEHQYKGVGPHNAKLCAMAAMVQDFRRQ